jgi:hypothetical protein
MSAGIIRVRENSHLRWCHGICLNNEQGKPLASVMVHRHVEQQGTKRLRRAQDCNKTSLDAALHWP